MAYDGVVFRALAEVREALRLARGLLVPAGFIGAYHRVGDAASGGPAAGLRMVATVPTVVPGLVLTGFRASCTGSPQ